MLHSRSAPSVSQRRTSLTGGSPPPRRRSERSPPSSKRSQPSPVRRWVTVPPSPAETTRHPPPSRDAAPRWGRGTRGGTDRERALQLTSALLLPPPPLSRGPGGRPVGSTAAASLRFLPPLLFSPARLLPSQRLRPDCGDRGQVTPDNIAAPPNPPPPHTHTPRPPIGRRAPRRRADAHRGTQCACAAAPRPLGE